MAFREASLETKASPAEVWRGWSDVNHWPEWNPDMKESRLDGPLKLNPDRLCPLLPLEQIWWPQTMGSTGRHPGPLRTYGALSSVPTLGTVR